MSNQSFGGAIASARKKASMSQKELAEKIFVEESEAKSISPQYLNDIEHDRRNPSSHHLVTQFASILSLDPEYLAFLAGRWPEQLRKAIENEDQFKEAIAAFRKHVQGR